MGFEQFGDVRVLRPSYEVETFVRDQTRAPRALDTSNRSAKEFYTVKQVAEIIGTSDKTVRRLQKRGFFKSSKALRTKQIPRSEIDRYKMETV